MVGVAVYGAGRWGKNLVRNFAALPGTELRYVCDPSEEVRERVRAQYRDTTVTDERERPLADPAVDGVVIAAPAPMHHELAIAALEAGKHVFVEKPLALSAEQATEVVELARRRGKKLMVGHLLKYHPAVDYLKRMLEGGEVGEVLYLYFQRVNLGIVRQDENAWWSLAPHDISVACHLFEAEPVTVTARGQDYLQNGVEDVVFANLQFADGRMANIHVSWLDPHKIRRLTLVGSQKMVVFDDMQAAEKIRIYDKGAVRSSVDSFDEAITLRVGDIHSPKIPSDEPLRRECQHFVDCIAKDLEPASNGEEGLRVVRVLRAGSESLKRGGAPIELRQPAGVRP